MSGFQLSMEKALRQHLVGGQFESVANSTARIMRAVRGRDNRTTERRLRLALVRRGIRGWELHRKDLPGSPDFFFAEKRVAVFVDGCFWHGCPTCGHVPQKNSAYWSAKIERNRARDVKSAHALRRLGFRVLRIWEHQLGEDLPSCVDSIARLVRLRRLQ